MKEIKPIIATTLPDQVNSKFTKNVLKKFCDQINSALTFLPVKDVSGKEIGKVKEGVMSNGSLRATIEVNTDLIDKSYEYFFIPDGGVIKKEAQGKFAVITKAVIHGVKMVKIPYDLSLKPIRFEITMKEGEDYYVDEYASLTPEVVSGLIKVGKPVHVFYPVSMGIDMIMEDAKERGLIEDLGDDKVSKIHPFIINATKDTFSKFRKTIKKQWQKFNSEKTENPLKNLTRIQSQD